MQKIFSNKAGLRLGIIFIIALITTVFFWQYLNAYLTGSKAGASSITLSLIPTSLSFTNNTDVKEFQLMAQFQGGTASEKIDYLKVKINFPKDNLELTDYVDTTTSSLGRQIRVDGPVAANGSGQIIIELGALTSGAGPSTDSQPVTIAKIKFKGKSDIQNGAITIDDSAEVYNNLAAAISPINKNNATFTVNGGGSQTNTPTPTGEPSLTAPMPTGTVTLSLSLKFQGIQSEPVGILNQLDVKVFLAGGGLTEPKLADRSDTFKADEKGIWHGAADFTGVLPGEGYYVLVKGPYHLQKKICDATPTETYPLSYHCLQGKIALKSGKTVLDFSGIYLLAGDLPVQDESITAGDTSLIYNNLGKTDNDKCDVNRDGICDTQDFSLVIAALSVKNDEF